MATFVLVHGSWHGGWCWRSLAPLLRQDGHDVFAPTLSGCAEKYHLAKAGVTLDTHVNDIAGTLFYEDLSDVVLVGHSYAGMVIHEVANRMPERIRGLIYLDAYVVPPGKKGFDLWTPERLAEARNLIAQGDPFRPPFPPEMLGISEPGLRQWVEARLTPHPLATYDRVLVEETPEAAALSRLYVQCTEGPLAPIFAPIVDAVKTRGWPVRSLAGPHNAMMTAPRQVADLFTVAALEFACARI